MVQLTWPIIALGWVINIFQRGTGFHGPHQSNPEEKPEITDVRRSRATDPKLQIHGEIEFRNLNFAYALARPRKTSVRAAIPVLNDINLRVPAGSSLAIVGPTGSGKSTLVNLIPRIYDAARAPC